MNDLIDRQAAIKAVLGLGNCYNGFSDTYDKACIIGVIEGIPAADAVEVVRCKKCEHYNAGFECLKEGYGIERNPNWFCADGERRDDERPD